MKIYLLAIVLLLITQLTFAQKTVVRHESGNLGGMNPVSVVDIEKLSIKEVAGKWTSYMKKTKGKVSKQDDTYFLDNANIKSISRDTLDIFSTVKGNGSSVLVTIAVNRDGLFINNSDGSARSVDEWLIEFAVDIKKEIASKELDAATKALGTKGKAYDKLESANKKLEKNISDMKNNIADKEREIKQNEITLGENKKEIEMQKEHVKDLEKKLNEIE